MQPPDSGGVLSSEAKAGGEMAVTETRLEVRLARRRQDVAAAQALRYRVFYKEMGAAPDLRAKVLRRDVDRFDGVCDHLLVIDRARRRRSILPVFGCIVGTCRLIRRDTANRRAASIPPASST